ncbi:hypothetical protein DIPPA_08514 [Diplonema papillatum]|nr:hypothetical protein DIPPA_08514 [Diplonema papillatum]
MASVNLAAPTGYQIVGAALAVVGGFVAWQYFTLMKATKVFKERKRAGRSFDAWLLSDKQRKSIDFAASEGSLVSMDSPAEKRTWNYKSPPKLRIDGASHFNNILGTTLTNLIFPDLAIVIPATRIQAPVEVVWQAFMDFDNYHKWNPFHSRIDVVEKSDERIYLGLNVNMGGLLGSLCSYEEVHFVDSKRHLLIYGVSTGVPSSVRSVWMESDPSDPNATIFNSFDMIGGYPALFSRYYIEGLTHKGFSSQHAGLKRYVEEVVLPSQK